MADAVAGSGRAVGLRIEEGPQAGSLRLEGRLDLGGAIELVARVARTRGPLRLDLHGVTSFTGSGVAALLSLLRQHGDSIRLRGACDALLERLEDGAEAVLGATATGSEEEEAANEPSPLEEVRAATSEFLRLAAEFVYWLVFAPLRGVPLRVGRIATEVVRTGLQAVPIVSLVSVLIGVILALNAASQLAQYGAERFAADLVAIALVREMGPVITAVLVAGRSGSAIAAEIATMRVSEEVDALRVMGINPRAYLVVPMLVALMITMPCLVTMADLIGIGGGFLVATGVLHLPFRIYWDATVQAIELDDLVLGWIKGVTFGLLVGLTAATLGLRVRGGAAGVGRVTTASVVTAFFLVILFNALFTTLFYAIRG